MPRIGVLGAGIAGLTAAYQLQGSGASVQVLEATDRAGGVIPSTKSDGFLVEHGPNSLRPTQRLETLIDDLNLEDRRVWADGTASKRYVIRDERPIPLPTSLGSFISTDLFSARAKLRLLAEPFIGRRSGTNSDESLAAFTRRRLGPEVLDYAVAPFVGGVFAGDPTQLSARHAFERLVDLEEEYGSLFWGGLRANRNDPAPDDAPSSLFSFHDGLETLPTALADALGDCVVRGTPVTALHHTNDGWDVEVAASNDEPAHPSFDAVISTLPLHALQQLDFDTPIDPSPLHDVTYPPVAVVALGYDRAAVEHPLDGFGMLVPPVEDQFDILGTIFSSTLFPGRAPDGHVLLTTFVGGARTPSLAERTPSALRDVVERDLNRLLGVTGDPGFAQHVHWPRAIPQYTLGYGTVKETLDTLEAEHDGLYFAGNYRSGVSVGDAVASGAAAASRALDALTTRDT
jgi:oxygen-dependent protoporphyrinogen oxidase